MTDTWIPFAFIARVHGVRGELLVKLLDEASGWPDHVETIQVLPKKGESRIAHVDHVRQADRALLVRLREINDRDQASLLTGATLCMGRESLKELEAGEFYVFELDGARVVDEAGLELGTVHGFFDFADQSVIDVQSAETTGLIPVTPDFIVHFDRAAHVITVRGHEGLWEKQKR